MTDRIDLSRKELYDLAVGVIGICFRSVQGMGVPINALEAIIPATVYAILGELLEPRFGYSMAECSNYATELLADSMLRLPVGGHVQ